MRSPNKTYKNIFEAAGRGDAQAVKYYVEEKNFHLSKTDDDNQTVAHIAAKRGNLQLLRYVLDENPFILPYVDVYNKPVLYRAIQKGSLDMIKYLIDERKVNVLDQCPQLLGNTAVHFAAELGKLSVLKYFVEEKHADVNVKNYLGETPLFSAAQESRSRVVKYLIEERSADSAVVDCNGENILYTLVWKNDLSLAKYFLRKNAMFDIDGRNDKGDTILNRATKLNYPKFVEYLVQEEKADVNIPDNLKRTPLHVAAMLPSIQLVTLLVEYGADIERRNAEGKTPSQVTTDYKIINYLDEAMGKLSRNRNRRSVSTTSFCSSYLTRPTARIAQRCQYRNLTIENRFISSTQPSLGFEKFFFSQLEPFLILAFICPKYFEYFAGRSSKNRSDGFLRIDPLALDVVRIFSESDAFKDAHKE